MAERNGHNNVAQQGDEYVCRVCGCRWDAQDERDNAVPKCIEVLKEQRRAGRS